MNFLQGLLSETNGTPSSLRISFLVWEIVLLIAFIVVIGYTIFANYIHNDFNPSACLTWIASIFAVNRGSKIIQKPFENNRYDDDSFPSPRVRDL